MRAPGAASTSPCATYCTARAPPNTRWQSSARRRPNLVQCQLVLLRWLGGSPTCPGSAFTTTSSGGHHSAASHERKPSAPCLAGPNPMVHRRCTQPCATACPQRQGSQQRMRIARQALHCRRAPADQQSICAQSCLAGRPRRGALTLVRQAEVERLVGRDPVARRPGAAALAPPVPPVDHAPIPCRTAQPQPQQPAPAAFARHVQGVSTVCCVGRPVPPPRRRSANTRLESTL